MLQVEFQKTKSFFSGQVLIEILVGLAVVGVVFVSAAELIFVSLKTARTSREKSLAQSLINDMGSSVKSIINYDWHDLWSVTGGLGYWHLDDGAGSANSNNLVIDEVFGNNGTISLGSLGNTSLSSAWQSSSNCKSGQCLSLDGSDDYVSFGNGSSLAMDGDLTVSFWVYPTSLSSQKILIGKEGVLSELELRIETTGGLLYYHGIGAYSFNCSVSAIFSPNTWVHIALVRDINAHTVSFYRNGVLQSASCGSWSDVGASSNDFGISLTADSNAYFAGRIDDLRLYDSVLSSSEIYGLYSGVNSFYPQNNAGIWQIHHGQSTSTVANTNFTRYLTIGAVQRDSSNNIVTSNGDFDPTTKKISFISRWIGGQVVQEEYISRTSLGNVFYQTDWSLGPVALSTVFLTPKNFYVASSTVTYSSSSLSLSTPSTSGVVDSMIFDSQIERGISPFSLVWQGELGSGNSVRFRLAASNNASGPWNFVGIDGTASSYFPVSGSSQANTQIKVLLPQFYNQRYFRYQVFLTYLDGDTSPRVDDIGLYWNR